MTSRVRGVGYLRVSTDRQADDGGGLDVQRAAIQAWTCDSRVTVKLWATDAGLSGTADLLDRPGLAEALGHIRAGNAQVLVVYRLDRLARDMVLQEQLLAEVSRLGGRVHSCSPTEDAYLVDDPTDPTRKLVRQILGVVAQYERAMIRLRMAAGKTRKLEQGGYAHGGPPYGWQAVGGELVEHPDEQVVVKRIVEARRRGYSYRYIADQLNAEGLLPRRGRWHPQTVARVEHRVSGVSRTRSGSTST